MSIIHIAENTPEELLKLAIANFSKKYISPDLVEFQETFMGVDWQYYMPRGLDLADYAVRTHMVASWLQYSFPAFSVTADLLSAFILTDPTNLSLDDIKPPFDTFVINLPRNFWFVDDQMATSLWYHHYKSRGEVYLHVEVGTPRNLRVYERIPSFWNDDVESVEDWLNFGVGEIQSVEQVEQTEYDKRLMRAARNILVNLSLYVAEHGRGIRKQSVQHHKKARQRTLTCSLPCVDTWIVGREIKLDQHLISAAKNCSGDDVANRAAWQISKRFVVRGHWRDQACGPGRQMRRRMWIQPYWKGPELGEKLAHIYNTGK